MRALEAGLPPYGFLKAGNRDLSSDLKRGFCGGLEMLKGWDGVMCGGTGRREFLSL